jgi:predicted TIM-barrel fold metal-dependent hydrolase
MGKKKADQSNNPETGTLGKGGLARRKLFQAVAAATPMAFLATRSASPLSAGSVDSAPLGAVGQRHNESSILKSLLERARQMMIFDTHEHIIPEDARLKSKVDVFLLLSHYTDFDLLSAGMSPQAVKNLQNHDLSREDRWKELAPYWARTRTTGYARCMLIAARDLFGVEDINSETYLTLSDRMAAANRPGWYQTVLKEKARIEGAVLDDIAATNGESLHPDPRFFKLVARFDYFLICSQRKDLEHLEKVTGVAVPSLAGMEKALEAAVEKRLQEGAVGFKCAAAYFRTLQFDDVSRSDAERAFDSLFGSPAADSGPALASLQKQLGDYMMHKLMQHAAERHLPVQIHTGSLLGSQYPVARTNPAHLTNLLPKYPPVRFALFHGGYPYTSEFAAIAKNVPNVYADLCWLHILAPGQAKKLLSELIETVPANKILGFGGDFLHVEGAYGHAQMARAVTAEVLAEKVEQGYLKEEEAANLLERILHQNGRELFASA